ncbi:MULTISPECIES: hypothetical protein [Methylobacterium]|jgi:hypothetical protein|uniref:Uncharacterized protein n=1 Tax=Methylobacterium isbiliense TaxID=315478 RepID=A0ABQ4SJI5_9HYPH|nr:MULTISPECIES: hypothetical protein [Methylobacterium]MDN3626491.1 hypothetical protein [Methylobacterium isbiliense]GJE03374.1 hypothetical protein GMJLKIPL_5328 [Methylobacterium isbiliense]
MAPPSHKPERTTNTVRPALLGIALLVIVVALVLYAIGFSPR